MEAGISSEAMEAAEKLFSMISLRFSLPPFLQRLFGVHDAAGRKPLGVIHNILKLSMEKKLKSRTEKKDYRKHAAEEKWENEKEYDFLDRLLENAGEGPDQFTKEEILDEMVLFFFAGHE